MTTRVTEGESRDAFFFRLRLPPFVFPVSPSLNLKKEKDCSEYTLTLFLSFFYLSSVDAFVDTVFIV